MRAIFFLILLTLASWAQEFEVWKPAQLGPKTPVVIFSHGFHGNPNQSKFLTEGLAQAGYLVVAPWHADANRSQGKLQASFTDPQSWTAASYQDRAEDCRKVYQRLSRDWRGRCDPNQLYLAGHSLGGYTVLGLAGAWPTWKMPPVKAVLGLSPVCSPFVQQGTLAEVKVPVMLQGGTRDLGVTPSLRRPGGAYDQLPKAIYVEFEKTGHFGWTDLQSKHHELMLAYALAFFDGVRRGESYQPQKKVGIADLRSK